MKYISDKKIGNHILQRAVDKLHFVGSEAFHLFCDEEDVSFVDRNRCISKCKIVFGDKIQEMQLPDELKNERWQYYIKEMRYHPNKAKKILNLIDKSYENQFIPTVDGNFAISSTAQN